MTRILLSLLTLAAFAAWFLWAKARERAEAEREVQRRADAAAYLDGYKDGWALMRLLDRAERRRFWELEKRGFVHGWYTPRQRGRRRAYVEAILEGIEARTFP